MQNVLIIMSDEHNPFYSSVYGNPSVRTPNMKRLAERGTVFENAYCPSPLCVPSRAAFMSGKRVHQIQTYNNCTVNLDRDIPAYGGVLKENGITTVHSGKSHVWDRSENLGFSLVLEPSADMPYPGDTMIRRDPLAIRPGSDKRADAAGVREEAFSHDTRVVDAAVGWLINEAPDLQTPWTLAVNLIKPHFPHHATQEFWDLYPEEGDLPLYGPETETGRHPYARDLRKHFQTEGFIEAQIRKLRKGYRACVSFVDHEIGRLLDALEKAGLGERTNVIYTSDHGEMLGKFGMWWKCSLYEDASRIPCLAAGPSFPRGRRVETPVDLLDVQATIFSMVGVDYPDGWIGEPLSDLPASDPERAVFSEYHGHGTRSGAFMIRKGSWKLIYYCRAENQLFHLEEDPDELHNLIEQNPQKAADLEEELRRICSPEKENEKARRFIEEQLNSLSSP